jgi:hypothetical protein
MQEIKFRSELGRLLGEFNLPRIVCEEGCAEGLFSKQICEWGLDEFWMIDLWHRIPGQSGDGNFSEDWHLNNYKEAMERVSKYNPKVLRGFTKDMIPQLPDNHFGMIYIDAAHDYPSVVSDLTLSLPKVVSGGIISGHDYLGYISVNKAVHDFCDPQHLEIHVVPDEESSMSSFWFRKP